MRNTHNAYSIWIYFAGINILAEFCCKFETDDEFESWSLLLLMNDDETISRKSIIRHDN